MESTGGGGHETILSQLQVIINKVFETIMYNKPSVSVEDTDNYLIF